MPFLSNTTASPVIHQQVLAGEAALQRRAAILNAVTKAAALFLGQGVTDDNIQQILAELGQATQVSRVYVFERDPGPDEDIWISQRWEWCAPGIESQLDFPVLQHLPLIAGGYHRWLDLFLHRQPVMGLVYDFNDDERPALEAQNILSIVLLPIFAGNEFAGCIGFDHCLVEHRWSDEELNALQSAAHILGAGILRNRTEKALAQSQARNQRLLNAIPDIIFVYRRDGTILDARSPNEQTMLRPSLELIGRSLQEFLPPEVYSAVRLSTQKATETQEPQQYKYIINVPIGTRTFEARIVAIGDDEIMALIRDVTVETQLDQMRIGFMNQAAHELRTPLTTLRLLVDLLQDGGPEEEMQQYWHTLRNVLERQHFLMEKLLTFGKLDIGKLKFQFEAIDLSTLLPSVCDTYRSACQSRTIELLVNVPINLPIIMGDRSQFQLVFASLLDNAVKFTPGPGLIQVRADARVARNQPGVIVSISDTGIGIPAQEMPYIFDRYYRSQYSIDKAVPGTGIGLYLVKSIIQAVGGEISVASVPGQGTTFTLWFPSQILTDL